MKTIRALITSLVIWVVGVGAYSLSFLIPLINDLELQSNIILALALIPLAWTGSGYYYSKYNSPNGYTLGLIMVFTAIVMDALVTVPILIIPAGGSYSGFFISASFWLIALLYFLVVFLHWYIRVRPRMVNSFN